MTARIEYRGTDGYTLTYAAEADLRDGLAQIAHRSGWEVETEHVVPGWGRPDLYLRTDGFVIAVEIKTDLSTPSRCRKAVQQADGYRVALPEASTVYLVAAHINREAMAPYAASYPHICIESAYEFLSTLGGGRTGLQARHRVARERFAEAERELELHRRVLRDLSCYDDSPLGVNIRSAASVAASDLLLDMLERATK